MDVTRSAFQFYLPTLLGAIADSHFVAIDLEFSGIASKQHGPSNTAERGTQTLQQRYEETKGAAGRYQVLQIGLTCSSEDMENGGYVLRPYNFHLNPVMEERLDIERIWSYQGSAVEFLLSNGFRMDAPFIEGVQYLSRGEEALAKRRALEKQDRIRGIVDIDIKEDDLESVQFMEKVRDQIKAWLAQGSKREESINVPPPREMQPSSPDPSLNGFQKRLVHQLVRAEFPALVTISRPGFIQINEFDQAREDAQKAWQMKRVEERISRQVGFRWVVEAMCGGNLSNLEPRFYPGNQENQNHVDEGPSNLRNFKNVRSRLELKRTVLVGHNLFTDLVNFYRCFFGHLPDRVEDFQTRIHELFPVVIDTKYLATHNCGSINPKSSLEEIERGLRHLKTPKIVFHPSHPKYEGGGQLHEAGYDSFLTAKVAIKLSTQLKLSGEYLDEDQQDQLSDEDYFTPSEGLEDSDITPKKSDIRGISPIEKFQIRLEPGQAIQGSTLDRASESKVPLISFDDLPDDKALKTEKHIEKAVVPALAHATRFEALKDLAESSLSPDAKLSKRSRRRKCGQKSLLDEHPTAPVREKGEFMPTFGDAFWSVYGNKLRVFGTVEGICNLSST